MFTLLRTSFVLFTLTLFASAASEENVTRQLDVAAVGKLVVDVEFGTISVTAGADDKVVVDAHRTIDFRDESKEKEYFANSPVTITKDGNVVTVRTRNTKSKDSGNLGHSEMNGRYVVHVPKKFETDLHTDGGEIAVAEIAAKVKAKTSGGTLEFKHIEGALDGTTSGGKIDIEDCRGPIDIETSGGDITSVNGNGILRAATSGGRIDVRNFSGDTEVNTGGGNLVLERITGKIIGKTSGGSIRASISGAVIGDVQLKTAAGNIDVALPTDATIDIVAKTSVGEVLNRLPLEVSETGREYLRGKLNGGGKSVMLQTSAGNITIKPGSEIVRR